ncbi:MAG: DUF4159 domain-containing protein [Planctomycetes bacterium]|nr:DUF4159 domain-containing protein [Planctomycetota bacterium]
MSRETCRAEGSNTTGRVHITALAALSLMLVTGIVFAAGEPGPTTQPSPAPQQGGDDRVIDYPWAPQRRPSPVPPAPQQGGDDPSLVHCANLTYSGSKTSVCFSDQFLAQAAQDTHIRTAAHFTSVRMDSQELFSHPFAILTGEGDFTFTDADRDNLKRYLLSGGFLLASAGCSSQPWNTSLQGEVRRMFPDAKLTPLAADHPVFHTVYDVTTSAYKSGDLRLPVLQGLEIDGRIVLIWSPDGLNDTANAGPNCCCCGGNEVKAAKKINVNILAYALTH